MKKGILFLFVIVLLFSFYSKVFANELCSPFGYSIYTVNGIFNDERGAKDNKKALESRLTNTYNNQPLTVDYLYNPSHLAGLGDLVDAVQQGLFEQKSDYDLEEMLNDASQKVTTQKVLLVAHSQGNFYANNFYDKTASQPGGIPSQSISVYGVASPANRVGGDGNYLTSDSDNVIASMVSRFIKILPPNIHIQLQNSDDENGHNFSDVYLKYQGDRIVSDIKSSLDNLKENDEQESGDPCISPPELSTIHKVQGVILAVADPTAIVVKGGVITTYNAGVYVANGVRDVGLAIGNGIHNTILAIRNIPKNLSANTVTALADDNNTETTSVDTPEVKIENPKIIITTPISVTETPEITQENSQPIVASVAVVTKNVLQPVVSYGGSVGAVGSPPSDITPPVITLGGNNPIDVTKDASYTDAGATALDNVDGVISVVTSGTVNIATVGVYIITYTATDVAGNVATDTRTVNVVASLPPDEIKPVITLVGDTAVTVTVGGIYADAGATATDNKDGNITANIVTVNPVNVNIIGDYTITYNVKDVALNFATEVTRLVHVIPPLSSVKIITAFNFSGLAPNVTGSINETNHNISLTVPFGTEVTALVPTITISEKATINPNNNVAQNFTNPVTYTVTAEDGSTQAYTVTVFHSAFSDIIARQSDSSYIFDSCMTTGWNGCEGINDHTSSGLFTPTAGTVTAIRFWAQTDVTRYQVVQLYNHTSGGYLSFAPSNYKTGITDGDGTMHLITLNVSDMLIINGSFGAFDGSTQAELSIFSYPIAYGCSGVACYGKGTYKGDVSNKFFFEIAGSGGFPPSETCSDGIQNQDETGVDTGGVCHILSSEKVINSFNFQGLTPNIDGVVNEADHTISLTVPFGTNVTALAPTITISSFATINPTSNLVQNFTSPVTYTVTAENNSTQDYIVTVTIAPDIVTKLKIKTSQQSIAVDIASSVIEVESQNASGELTKVSSTTDVNLSSNSETGLLASSPDSGPCNNDNSGWGKTKIITISTNTARRHFCYKDSVAGTPTITVSAAGLTSDFQTIIVN